MPQALTNTKRCSCEETANAPVTLSGAPAPAPDWRLVFVSAAAGVGVVALFALAMKRL